MVKAARVIGLAACGLAACTHAPQATRYIIESGTTGWVKIKYNRGDAPALPVETGLAVVRVSRDLTIDTKNAMQPSWEKSEFYLRGRDGRMVRLSTTTDDDHRQLWGMEKISDSDGDREVFFVGSPEKFTNAGRVRNFTPSADAHPESVNAARREINPMDRLKVETSLSDLVQ
jgi:hypothetical protein